MTSDDRHDPPADDFSLAVGIAITVLLAQLSIAGWMFYELWRRP